MQKRLTHRPIRRAETPETSFGSLRGITEMEIQAALHRGRKWRSRVLRRALRKAFRLIVPWHRTTRIEPSGNREEGLEHHLMTSLTALRSSAEILRDHPEIGQTDRQRFLAIVLSEEARLERLLRSVLNRVPTA